MNLSTVLKFFRDVKAEGKKVTWPGLKQTRGMTIMVFILVTIIALYLLLVDMTISTALNFLLEM